MACGRENGEENTGEMDKIGGKGGGAIEGGEDTTSGQKYSSFLRTGKGSSEKGTRIWKEEETLTWLWEVGKKKSHKRKGFSSIPSGRRPLISKNNKKLK